MNTTLPGLAGGSFSPPSLSLNAYQDGVAEESEGFILYLEIVESELDPRDVGSVSVSRSAYLIRINQSSTTVLCMLMDEIFCIIMMQNFLMQNFLRPGIVLLKCIVFSLQFGRS